jgi:hypothetical protein
MGTMDVFHGRCVSYRFYNLGTSSGNGLLIKLVHLQSSKLAVLLQHENLIYLDILPSYLSAAPSCEDLLSWFLFLN